MLPIVENLLKITPSAPVGETLRVLLHRDHLRLEHIISQGQASPEGFWYEQEEDEWVLLLVGTATLVFPEDQALELEEGDTVTLPAGMKHRVAACSPDARWLALHLDDRGSDCQGSGRPSP